MRCSIFLVVVAAVCAVAVGWVENLSAGEIGFIEDFALAKDRSEALKQLIPGTEDFYYYNCIHLQNTEQFDQVAAMLDAWIKRYGYTPRVKEIRNRQALLTYAKDPNKSLEHIRQELGVQFNHQREVTGERPNFPTAMDQAAIGRDRLTQAALQRYQNTDGFEDAALEWLAATELNGDRRRHLIQRLTRPDLANLPALVVADLQHANSGGFGQFGIHNQLLQSQLDELLKLKPDLLNQQNFVNAYLAKLQPSPDVDWQHDAAEQLAHLDRLWAFVSKLAPVHNSLKANVLYRRLILDRTKGVFDKDRFMTYIQLPRNVVYINPEFMKVEANRQFAANLNQDFQPLTLLPIVGDDEPLVRSFLHHFFVTETTYAAFAPFISDQYLKVQFAETKIVNGLGEPEQWFSLLPPATYQALKDRVDIDFDHANRRMFAAEDPVSLDVYVKNVKTLIVKVFEINTDNFYRQQLREVNTDINLDGLVANEETTHNYPEPPLRRVKRHFDFPALSKPGVYVIDFIGSGRNSRVVVRKGKLRQLVRNGAAGQVFTILNEKNEKLDNARLWLAGREYLPGKDGTIVVPYSNEPGRQPIVISHGGLSSLQHFEHQSENYSLTAGIYTDRESLLKRKKAQVIVRPGLTLNGTPISVKVLEDVVLSIQSVDHDGVSTVKEVKPFELFNDKESVYEFQVPQRMSQIGFSLRAKVKVNSQNQKIDLAAGETFSLNAIDKTDKIQDLHFSKAGANYSLDLLGKSGEPLTDRPVNLQFKHRDFRDPVHATLQSDARGRIELGAIAGIDSITATTPEGVARSWSPVRDQHSHHQVVHGRVGEPILVPFMGAAKEPTRDDLSLLEVRGGTFVGDRFNAIALENGLLKIGGLPAGDYDLLLKNEGVRITLRVTAGEEREGFVLSGHRQLEVRNASPLQISGISPVADAINVQLTGASEFSRVHVFATRYQPEYSPPAYLGRVVDAEPYLLLTPRFESLYVEGRDIGDEYRYIIDRRYAPRFPGNMLERPSLLLNPWPIRSTESGRQDAAAGSDFAPMAKEAADAMARGEGRAAAAPPSESFSNLDFLANTSAVLINLAPDENGVVKIARASLGPHQQLHVVAVDPRNTAYRTLSMAEMAVDFLDLRLANSLPADVHFTQQKQVSVVEAKNTFTLADVSASKFEAYDSLGKVYSLYLTLSSDPKLIQFGFVLGWHDLKPDEKQAKYSEYACHELNFFLSRKDPEFFEASVKPFLANKKYKTFMDRWLIGADLRSYLNPWAFSQLNVVERILLGRRLAEERAAASRHVQELFDILPPDLERRNFLFDTALKGSALDTGDRFGIQDLAESLESKPRDSRELLAENGAMAFGARAGGLQLKDAERSEFKRQAGDKLEVEEMRKQLAATAPAAPPPGPAGDEQQLARRYRGLDEEAKKSGANFYADDMDRLAEVRQLYRQLDKTQEWVENNYYRLPIEQQNAELVSTNVFWNDYAQRDPAAPFHSVHFADASRSFTEMMFALSVLDLPFKAGEHETKFDNLKMTLTAASPMVVFHEEIKAAGKIAEQTPILVSQNLFRHGDRHRIVNNEQVDKYVTDEFLVSTVYGCQVVVTNPTSSRQKLEVLLQVPQGAIPVLNGQNTRSVNLDLQPFNTQTIDYFFYFPQEGSYPHYPVHVSKNEQLLAFAAPAMLKVVETLSRVDRESWQYISQNGTPDEVVQYLNANNLQRTDLNKIAFRMGDGPFFQTITGLLLKRHVYNHVLWSYSLKHNSVPQAREFLQHSDAFVQQSGDYIDSPLLTIDPVARKSYQHMDYRPLVNARVHMLGQRRQIVNERLLAQYQHLLKIVGYRRDLDDGDLMAVTYYLLLQDRVEEAKNFFNRVNPESLTTRLQYDYFAAYTDFFTDEPKIAPAIVARYAAFPVQRWREAFANIGSQLKEIGGQGATVVDPLDRTQTQTNLAATEPNFEFRVENKKIHLTYQNLTSVTVNHYLMDIELLFSRNPFVQQFSGQFSFIRPNATLTVALPADQKSLVFDLPEQFHNSNVLVEITAAGQIKTAASYSNAMTLQVIENYGQLRVTTANPGKPISKAYVKVYAQMHDGSVRFFKDGYTDLRGRFDYSSLSTSDLDNVTKFSLLVISDAHGAIIREATPPRQ